MNYRNTEILITEIQKYRLQKYGNAITEVLKYKNRNTEIQV